MAKLFLEGTYVMRILHTRLDLAFGKSILFEIRFSCSGRLG